MKLQVAKKLLGICIAIRFLQKKQSDYTHQNEQHLFILKKFAFAEINK